MRKLNFRDLKILAFSIPQGVKHPKCKRANRHGPYIDEGINHKYIDQKVQFSF